MILQEPTLRVIRKNDPEGYIEGSFKIVDPLIFLWRAKRCIVTIQSGMVTNFASIPTGFRNLFPVNGPHRLAAVAHDALYSFGGVLETSQITSIADMPISTLQPVTVYYSRKEADDLFYAIMRSEGVGKLMACSMYTAVRWFGGLAWSGE